MKLLIVDDSLVIRNKIDRVLGEQFSEIYRAGDGAKALVFAAKYKPDIITMDLTMPELSGIDCIKQLKKVLPQCRILVISALADKATAIESIKLGANGFLSKPFGPDELRIAIAKILQL